MSLINRIEVSCFLDSSHLEHRKAAEWRPDYVGVVFDVRGANSIIAMENGYGKTSIAEAVLAVISRDRELISRTRQRMSPKAFGPLSHIRVEILVQHNATQDDIFGKSGEAVPGEKHVLGIYGNSDGADHVKFYYYRGTLEDCPVAHWHEGIRVAMVLNTDFRAGLRTLMDEKRAKNDLTAEEWKVEVSKYFEHEVIGKLVEYQKKGGGDVNAVFYKVARRHGESFDSAFFYQHIAPELLVNVMGSEAEEGEYRFEQTVRISSLKVLQAMYANRQEEKLLSEIKSVVEALSNVLMLGRQYSENLNIYNELLGDFKIHGEIIKNVVIDDPLPGLPPSILPDDPNISKIAASGHLMVQNHELYFIDRGLAEILGEEAKEVNRRADRNRILSETCRIAEVIEIPCHHGSLTLQRPQGGGPSNRLYTQENALKLLEVSTNFAPEWDKETALEALKRAFEWAERNDYRRQMKSLSKEIAHYEETIETIEKGIQSNRSQINDYKRELEKIRDAKMQYNKIAASGLFSDSEHKEPFETGRLVENHYSSLKEQLDSHITKKAKLESSYGEYLEFRKHYGEDSDPRDEIAKIKESREKIREAKKDAEKKCNELQAMIADIHEERTKTAQRISALEAEIGMFESMLPEVQEFRKLFGDVSPKGLRESVKAEYETALYELKSIEGKLSGFKQQLQSLTNFRQKYGDTDPELWVSERRRKWEEAEERKRNLSDRLNELRARRDFLERFKIAPSRQYRDALSSAGEGSQRLHQVIDTMELDDSRRESVMTLFSNFLFAPVFDTVEAASDAAQRLHSNQIEVPTFVLKELSDFIENGEIKKADGAVFSFFVGIRTRPVDCLLDPALVDREKSDLGHKISGLEQDISAVQTESRELDPQSPESVEAQAAAKALKDRIEIKVQDLTDRKRKIESSLFRTKERNDAIVCIKKMEEFLDKGGDDGYSAAREKHGNAERKTLDSLSRLEEKKKELIAAQSCLDGITTEYERAYSSSDELASLEVVSKFLFEENGLPFMESAKSEQDKLKEMVTHAEKRTRYDFSLAQEYVDYGHDRVTETEGIINSLEISNSERRKKKDELDTRIKSCSIKREKLQRDAIWLDEKVSTLVRKYRSLKKVAVDIGCELQGEVMGAEHEWLKNIKAFRAIGGFDEQSHELLSRICAEIDEYNLESIAVEIREAKKKTDSAKETYENSIDGIFEDRELKLNDVERNYLVDAKSDFTKVQMMFNKFSDELDERVQNYNVTKKAVDEARDKLADRLDNFATRLKFNFDLFRKVIKFKRGDETSSGEAGFEVTATMKNPDEAQGIIERIVNRLEADAKDREQESQGERNIFDFDKSENESIDSFIRDTFYRFMFVDPNIRVYFPSMKSGRTFPFNPDHEKIKLSQGQKAALSLLWIIKFAEFAIEREVHAQSSFATSKRKLRAQKERVFIVDGLFSSLSSKTLLREALQSITKIRGRFQLIGLVHNLNFQVDMGIFPTYYIAKRLVEPGGRNGVVLVEKGDKPVSPKEVERREGEIAVFGLHYDTKRPVGKDRRS